VDLTGLEYEPPMWDVSVLLLDLKNEWLHALCAPTPYSDGGTCVPPVSAAAFTVPLR
jgi:hypothetical protein